MAVRISMTHAETDPKMERNPGFCNAVKELGDQYALLDAVLPQEKEQQLSQSDVAKIPLPRSAVCGLESKP